MTSEFDNFDKAARKILSVSRDELRRREEKWKEGRNKRKPKTSPSARVSSSKG